MSNKVPTLTVDGWQETPRDKLNTLFNYFIDLDNDRTFFFKNNITSFKFILSVGTSDNEIKDSLERECTNLLERYFNSATVLVKKVVTNEHFSYAFEISVTDTKSNTYKLNQTVSNNGVFKDVVKLIKG